MTWSNFLTLRGPFFVKKVCQSRRFFFGPSIWYPKNGNFLSFLRADNMMAVICFITLLNLLVLGPVSGIFGADFLRSRKKGKCVLFQPPNLDFLSIHWNGASTSLGIVSFGSASLREIKSANGLDFFKVRIKIRGLFGRSFEERRPRSFPLFTKTMTASTDYK